MDSGRTTDKHKAILVFCGVIALSALMGGWMLTAEPVEGHEAFVSVTAREMLAKGDFVVPTFNGNLRLQKTPLCYWLCAAVGKVRGQVDEFAVRVPSVFLGVISVAAVMLFATRWLTFRCGIIAGCVWLTSYGFLRYAHSGRPEMALACFVCISFLSFYSAVEETNRKRQIIYSLIFWLSFSLAMLAKGPAPLPLVGGPLFVWYVISHRWKTIGKVLPVIGGLIFLAIILAWPVMLAMRLSDVGEGGFSGMLTFWKAEFVDRFTGSGGASAKPFYYYLPVMFQLMLPWVAFVAMGLAAPFYKVWAEKRKAMLFLWTWFAVDVAVMSISGGKRMHYILPAMPAMAILVGILLDDMIFANIAYTPQAGRKMLRYHVITASIGAAAGPVIAAVKRPELLGGVIVISVIALATVGAVVFLFAKGKKYGGCGAIFTGCAALLLGGYTLTATGTNLNEVNKQFALSARKTIAAEGKVAAYGDVTSKFVHYFGRVVPVEKELSRVYASYEEGVWVIAHRNFMEELKKDGRFEMVYYSERAKREGDSIVGGGIFHRPQSIDNSTTQ